MIYTKSPLPKVDKVIEKLYEDLIKYKNKKQLSEKKIMG
jgi:ribosome-associated translation inhibitor RaiA